LQSQWPSGTQRLQLTWPCPDVVDKGREATAKNGNPQAPKVSLLGITDVANGSASRAERPPGAALLGLPQDEVPPLRLTWCHWSRGPQGALLGHCPKVPSDLEAQGG
jgi:hypothetical protein